VLLALAALMMSVAFAAPASADDQTNSSHINVYIKGSGNVRFETYRQIQDVDPAPVQIQKLGLTCPTEATLNNSQTNEAVLACPPPLNSYYSGLSALQEPDACGSVTTVHCDLFVWIDARPPAFPLIPATQNDYWTFGGWTGPCDGPGKVCKFKIGECNAGICTYEDFETLEKAPHLLIKDVHKPSIIAATGPGTPNGPSVTTAADGKVTFTFRSDEYEAKDGQSAALAERSTFYCKLDTQPEQKCGEYPNATAPQTFTLPNNDTGDGIHVLKVRPVDVSGQSARTETYTFTQVFPPVISGINGGTITPGSVTQKRTADLTFTADRTAGTTYTCTLDGVAYAGTCNGTAKLAGLADGPHTFAVRATRRAGDVTVDGATVSLSWTVDTVAPTTVIDSGPQEGERFPSASATFTFHALGEVNATYVCERDGVRTSCNEGSITYSGLGPGPHTFKVFATDAAGNVGPAASRGWRVLDDNDQDGYFTGLEGSPQNDCDDTNPAIHPGVPEIFNNTVDENCDNVIAFDRDGDGFPSPGTDCDDNDASTHPGAVDVYDDDKDQDCVPPALRHPDADGDGYLAEVQDCDDGNPAVHPGAKEIPGNKVDENCDAVISPTPVPDTQYQFRYGAYNEWTTLTALNVLRVPAGVKVQVRCKGSKKCPFGTRTVKVAKPKARLALHPLIPKPRRLPGGSVLEVVVSGRGWVTHVRSWEIRRNKPPRNSQDYCLRKGKRTKCDQGGTAT